MGGRLERQASVLRERIDTTLAEKKAHYPLEPLLIDPFSRQKGESEIAFQKRLRGMYKEALIAPFVHFGVIPEDILAQVRRGKDTRTRYQIIEPYILQLPLHVIEVVLDSDQKHSLDSDGKELPSRYSQELKHGTVEETIRKHQGWAGE